MIISTKFDKVLFLLLRNLRCFSNPVAARRHDVSSGDVGNAYAPKDAIPCRSYMRRWNIVLLLLKTLALTVGPLKHQTHEKCLAFLPENAEATPWSEPFAGADQVALSLSFSFRAWVDCSAACSTPRSPVLSNPSLLSR